MDTILQLLVIIVLTFFEAIFVAAEIALVTIRRTRIEQLADEGNRSARRVKHLVASPGRFLAVTQIGLTFLGFLASAYAAVNLTASLEAAFKSTGLPIVSTSAQPLALIIVTLLLSLFTIVFGELVPKSLALAHTEQFALRLSGFIVVLLRVLGPLVGVLTAITTSVARMLGAGDQAQGVMSTEELKILVERGGEQGILEAEEEQMIHAVIELGDQRVHEVMVPRIATVTLAASASMEEAIDTVIEEGHSRIPVYEDTIDEIIGILYAKDLLPFLRASAPERPALRSILRTPVFVPESMSVDDLLHEFQRRKVHIAIVLDEYGGTAGLVTIEDLLEEIVGEIQDEYDEEEPLIVRLSEDEARIDGRADVDDLAELFDTNLGLEDADEYDTVGGLLYHRIGGIPKPGDQVQVGGLTLTVETTDGRRVGKVLAVRHRDPDAPDDDEADR
ncbi:MAG: magnesium and cobalt exporter, family [Chloroflexota bacterium]|jgi:putative hemolysin|nr:magnesium and cobalt exporter, family [Chloroflexota bacterium]MEA2653498.1 magnesium and cobalt exporter, family [Chloroflexota bacterium]